MGFTAAEIAELAARGAASLNLNPGTPAPVGGSTPKISVQPQVEINAAPAIDPEFDNVTPGPKKTAEPSKGKTPASSEPEKPQPKDFDLDGPITKPELLQKIDEYKFHNLSKPTRRYSIEEIVEELTDEADDRGSKVDVSEFEDIVVKFMPKDTPPSTPNVQRTSVESGTKTNRSYPPELAPLVEAGKVTYDNVRGRWVIDRCECGTFQSDCCGKIEQVSVTVPISESQSRLTKFGRQAAGLDPIERPEPKTPEQIQEEQKQDWLQEPWWYQFSGVDELEGDGQVKWYIKNFLPEGICLVCGLPKRGKSFVSMATAKALTTGKPLFGRPEFAVPECVPVLYLTAEMKDGQQKLRCKKFNITADKTKFITRTLSKGPMFGLDDPYLKSLVQAMKPVIIIETLTRFDDGDEDSATDSRKLAKALFDLLGLGARAIMAQHHSRKDFDLSQPTMEAASRGSGDKLAMADMVWAIVRDERLYNKGINEIDVVGWARDSQPPRMRLALTGPTPKDFPAGVITFAPGVISYVDTYGNLKWVDRQPVQEQRQKLSELVNQLVTENPLITRGTLIEKTGATQWEVQAALKKLGYRRPSGGKDGAKPWTKGPL